MINLNFKNFSKYIKIFVLQINKNRKFAARKIVLKWQKKI